MKSVVVKVRRCTWDTSNGCSHLLQMIKAGQPVFFGCDVGKLSDRDTGIMDTALFEYEVSPDPLHFGDQYLSDNIERLRYYPRPDQG